MRLPKAMWGHVHNKVHFLLSSIVVSHSLHAAGGTFKQASTCLDINIPADESERFSTAIYNSITEQTKVYYNKEIVDTTDTKSYNACCRWKHYHRIIHCQS